MSTIKMETPELILNMIFPKISSLIKVLRLRQVSRLWGDLIEKIFEEKNLWKQLCSTSEINPWVYNITEIIFQNTMKDWSRPLLPKSWKKIFLFHNEWNFNMKTKGLQARYDLEDMEHFSEEISAIDMHDVYIATCHEQMKIIISESGIVSKPTPRNIFVLSLLYEVKKKLKKIIKIKFWLTYSKRLILVVHLIHRLTMKSTLKYFDVIKKQKIENPFKSQTNIQNFTCTSNRLFVATSKTIYECMWKENKLNVGYIFEIKTILNKNEMQQMKILEMCAKLDFKVDRLAVLIQIAADKVRAITLIIPRNEKERFKKLDCDRDIIIKHDDSLHYIPMPGILFAVYDSEMVINLWWSLLNLQEEASDQKDRIVPLRLAEVSDLNRDSDHRRSQSSTSSSSSVGGFRDNPLTNFKSTYRILRSGRLKISSILFLCNILIIGLYTGDLEIYFLDNIKTLTKTDFYAMPRKVINICEDPIISINLFRQKKNFFNVIVTTPKAIYFKEFTPTEDMMMNDLFASIPF
ncbi:uncharacterized protein [Chelonus insularis]|uniref:uncharacterized protein isoform X2 n=1 Tax=Chelonus insularis TaxID=460826 RepID=UPI00158D2F32|nr:uncharacterized protein LOC118069818 isoform X2 [Chelonus insularis]